jgi:ribosomal protein S18 acetylase RimI-like enzyme
MQTSDDSPLVIRPAVAGDLPVLGRLGAMLVRIHHDFDPLRFIDAVPDIERLYADFLGRQLADPSAVVLTAERGGEVIGYALGAVVDHDYMALRGPAGLLYDILVDPAHRGGGVGRTLLDAALAAFAAKGAPRVVLSTAQRNEAAQRLFERAGFRRTMVEMTRELGPDA